MTMHYPRIIAAFNRTPLALLPEKAEEIRLFLEMKALGGEVSEEEIKSITAGKRPMQTVNAGRVGILPIFGVISQRVSGMERASGGVSTEEIGATLEDMANDRSLRAILMHIDSPGGSVAGVPELADKIRALGAKKKIVAFADPMAASAAYWLGSQAQELTVSPSGQVGSIGVITQHIDITKYQETLGVKTTLVSSAPYKAEGWPEVALSEEARSEMQGKVDAYHRMFVGAIAKGRGLTEARVEKDFGGGRMIMAKDAVTRGMADSVATLETVLKRLGAYDGEAGASAARAIARAVEVEEICSGT
jgi:signal peptide peptidase SppA